MNEEEFAKLLDKINKAEHDVNLMSKVLDASNSHHRFIVKILGVLLGLSILFNAVTVGAFVWYESQFEYVWTDTGGNQTQEASGENSNINNVEGDQYNDSAIHNDTE